MSSPLPMSEPPGTTLSSDQRHTKRRGAIACRRCRRLRGKCVNDNGDGVPPCRACKLSGRSHECVFVKGNSVLDRKDTPRARKRAAAHDLQTSTSVDSTPTSVAQPFQFNFGLDEDSILYIDPGLRTVSENTHAEGSSAAAPATPPLLSPPPRPVREVCNPVTLQSDHSGSHGPTDLGLTTSELKEAVDIYFNSFYQVGFLHRPTFYPKLINDYRSISPFLIFAILSLTAGASSTLMARLKCTPEAARAHFKDKAMSMLADQCLTPSLECIQALYLLGLNDFGAGCGSRSWMLIGMGLRMVELLKLASSETYAKVNLQSSTAERILAESSRRTVWSLLIADDSLAVGFGSSSPASKLHVTIPTPCDEDDWDFGSIPLVVTPESASRSLMGNTLSIMSLWSRAARWAASVERKEASTPPWDPNGEMLKVNRLANDFVNGLSDRLRYSSDILAVHRNRRTDMAFTHLHLVHRGTHILLRRMYLPSMLMQVRIVTDATQDLSEQIANLSCPPTFWAECAEVTYRNSVEAIDICLEYMSGRDKAFPKGFTPLMCFVLFLGGAMMSYLVRWPALCPSFSPQADEKTSAAIDILKRLAEESSVAARWYAALCKLHNTAKHPEEDQTIGDAGFTSWIRPLNASGTSDNGISSPTQSDPLGVLAGLAVSQPVITSIRPPPPLDPVLNEQLPSNSPNLPSTLDLDMFAGFSLSSADLATAFGFGQLDFNGL